MDSFEPARHEIAVPGWDLLQWRDITVQVPLPLTQANPGRPPRSFGGGFAYRECSHTCSATRNRFIVWRGHGEILELVELSLDTNLAGNAVRYRFPGYCLLPGAAVHELPHCIVAVFATETSVHRLTFPHPSKLPQRADMVMSLSVFQEASVQAAGDSHGCAAVSVSGGVRPHQLATHLQSSGTTTYALACQNGSISIVVLAPPGSPEGSQQFELRQTSVIHRLWSGIIPTAIRGSSYASDAACSVCLHRLGKDLYVFALCRDHKLRIWSCNQQECIQAVNIMEFIADTGNLDLADETSHRMIKGPGESQRSVSLALFLAFDKHQQFCFLQVELAGNELLTHHVANRPACDAHLVDFSVTKSDLWTLWVQANGDSLLQHTTVEGSLVGSSVWRTVERDDSLPQSVHVLDSQEPREIYLAAIFFPGRFSMLSIQKAIEASGAAGSRGGNMAELRSTVSATVAAEVTQAAPAYEMEPDEFRTLQISCWQRFYSMCVEYEEMDRRFVGIFANSHLGLAGVIHQSGLSLVRVCDNLETAYLSPQPLLGDQLPSLTCVPFDATAASIGDMLAVMYSCRDIARQFPQDCREQLQDSLMQGGDPSVAMQSAFSVLYDDRKEAVSQRAAIDEAVTRLVDVEHLPAAFVTLLATLDVVSTATRLMEMSSLRQDPDRVLWCQRLFCSSLATVCLARAFRQIAHVRQMICQDLLFGIFAILQRRNEIGLQNQDCWFLASDCLSRTVQLLRVHSTLRWMSEVAPISTPVSTIEANLQHLAALNLSDVANMVHTTTITALPDRGSLLELCLSVACGPQLRSVVAARDIYWQCAGQRVPFFRLFLLPIVDIIAELLWPLHGSSYFADFLTSWCQHLCLEDYVSLVRGWCELGQGYLAFLRGHCYLQGHEVHKALDCFIQAAQGIDQQETAMERFYPSAAQSTSEQLVAYYIKVLQLFEQRGCSEQVIVMATTALAVAEEMDPNVPVLWSSLFKHHLQLDHVEKAYIAMAANPDPVRRQDSLRRLVFVLYDKRMFDELCRFPFVGLQEEVVNIMEARARTVDISHNYYELLYSFHVLRGNYKKAAASQYECSCRLVAELPNLKGLQRRAKCLVAAMNALRLVRPENAWLVKPADHDMTPVLAASMHDSLKRHRSGAPVSGQLGSHRRVTVLDMDDLHKEHMLITAKLKLMHHNQDELQAAASLVPREVVTLLVQAGLFSVALDVSATFKLARAPVLEGLTARCVKLSGMAGQGGSHAADSAWQELQQCLMSRVPSDQRPQCVRAITSHLLAACSSLPQWLEDHYKKTNPAELLRLLQKHGRIRVNVDREKWQSS